MRQNHIDEYRDMLRVWHERGIAVQAGYIVGFPADTPESIGRDVESLKTELPLDLVKFACLMPLPGSVDHRDKLLAGEWMDPDLNLYTGEKAVTHHPRMRAGSGKRPSGSRGGLSIRSRTSAP